MRKIIIGLVLLVSIGFCMQKLLKDSSTRKFEGSYYYILTPNEKQQLQTGDIILRRGYGFVSSMILKYMNEPLGVTHIGIILRDRDQLSVAHTLSSSVSDQDGLRIQQMDAFTHNSHDSTLVVVRLKNMPSKYEQLIKDQVNYYLEKDVPFDKKFDYRDTTAHYCSELIWRIYEHNLGLLQVADSVSADEKYNTLKTFYDTNYFDIILNHHPLN